MRFFRSFILFLVGMYFTFAIGETTSDLHSGVSLKAFLPANSAMGANFVAAGAGLPSMSESAMMKFAQDSAKAEFGGTHDGIVEWGNGENWLSVGIGHYLWGDGAKNSSNASGESFRAMMKFAYDSKCYQGSHPSPPAILHYREGNIAKMPFNSPNQLKYSSEVTELRNFLWNKDMQICQVRYQINRLQIALKEMMGRESGNSAFRRFVENFVSTPGGYRVLLDYVNFKGEGLGPKPSGGLYQVLKVASQDNTSTRVVNKFTTAWVNILESVRGPKWWKMHGEGMYARAQEEQQMASGF